MFAAKRLPSLAHRQLQPGRLPSSSEHLHPISSASDSSHPQADCLQQPGLLSSSDLLHMTTLVHSHPQAAAGPSCIAHMADEGADHSDERQGEGIAAGGATTVPSSQEVSAELAQAASSLLQSSPINNVRCG